MSRNFSGATTDRIEVNNSINPAGSFTVCAWVKVSTGTDFRRVVSNRQDPSGVVGYISGFGSGASNDKLRFLVAVGGTFRTATPVTGIADSSWHFWVGRYTAAATDVIEVFIDDMDSADASVSGTYGTYNTTADNLTIGNNPSANAALNFPGDIADVRIYDSALTAGERKMVKAGKFINATPQLIAPLGYGTEPDWSGNVRTLTATGSTISDNPPIGPAFGFDIGVPYEVAAASGRINSLVNQGGLAGAGGIAGQGGGLSG